MDGAALKARGYMTALDRQADEDRRRVDRANKPRRKTGT